MDISEGINTSDFDERLVHQNTRLEKERDQGIKNVVQQSIYEEKLGNNGLYASIFMHSFIIVVILFIISLKMNLIVTNKDNNPDMESLKFSFLEFETRNSNLDKRNKQTYSYFCFNKNLTQVGNGTVEICSIDYSCEEKGLNYTIIKNYFMLECEQFVEFRNLGIIVRILYFRKI